MGSPFCMDNLSCSWPCPAGHDTTWSVSHAIAYNLHSWERKQSKGRADNVERRAGTLAMRCLFPALRCPRLPCEGHEARVGLLYVFPEFGATCSSLVRAAPLHSKGCHVVRSEADELLNRQLPTSLDLHPSTSLRTFFAIFDFGKKAETVLPGDFWDTMS